MEYSTKQTIDMLTIEALPTQIINTSNRLYACVEHICLSNQLLIVLNIIMGTQDQDEPQPLPPTSLVTGLPQKRFYRQRAHSNPIADHSFD